MLCALTVRKLKPGAYESFLKAWEPEEFPEGFKRAYHVRSLDDENEIISFGFYDKTIEDLAAIRDDQNEEQRQRRIAEHVRLTLVDGMFEVVDEVVPPEK